MNRSLFAIVSLSLVLCCVSRAPTPIPPKNPEDPLNLPEGVSKKALVVGN